MPATKEFTIDKESLPPILNDYFQDKKVMVYVLPDTIMLSRNSDAKKHHCPLLGIFRDDPISIEELEKENQINKELEK